MGVQEWELGELVALSRIGEKGRGREEVVMMDDEGMRCSQVEGKGSGHRHDIKAAAVHSE